MTTLSDISLAAENGMAEAQYTLGETYLWGRHGLQQSNELAHHWLQAAAEQGTKDALQRLSLIANRQRQPNYRSFTPLALATA